MLAAQACNGALLTRDRAVGLRRIKARVRARRRFFNPNPPVKLAPLRVGASPSGRAAVFKTARGGSIPPAPVIGGLVVRAERLGHASVHTRPTLVQFQVSALASTPERGIGGVMLYLRRFLLGSPAVSRAVVSRPVMADTSDLCLITGLSLSAAATMYAATPACVAAGVTAGAASVKFHYLMTSTVSTGADLAWFIGECLCRGLGTLVSALAFRLEQFPA